MAKAIPNSDVETLNVAQYKLEKALAIHNNDATLLRNAFKFFVLASLIRFNKFNSIESGIESMKKAAFHFQECLNHGSKVETLFNRLKRPLEKFQYLKKNTHSIWRFAIVSFFVPQIQPYFFKAFSDITELDLQSVLPVLSDPLKDILAFVLNNSPRISNLNLGNTKINQESLLQLLKNHGKNITNLNLSSLNIYNLHEILLCCPNLQFLDVSACSSLDINDFSQVSSTNHLRSLILNDYSVANDSIIELISSYVPSLENLELSRTPLTDQAITYLTKFNNLYKLNIAGFFLIN